MSTGEVDVGRGHQGSEDLAVNRTQSDHNVRAIADRLLHTGPLGQFFTFTNDTFRTAQTERYRFGHGHHIQLGRIVHALPLLNWYKVQMSDGGAIMPAAALSEGSFANIGVHSTSTYGPNNPVLIHVPPGLGFGFILGAIPEHQSKGDPNICDWVLQGSNAGVKREVAHKRPIKVFFRQGGVKDFSNRRTIDGTGWEWGMMSESGIGIHLDSYLAFLRVSEICGLFLNYWDNRTRLAGLNLDVQSNVVHDSHREDEGENQRIVGQIVYPWEAVGCYKDGEKWVQEFPDDDVHYKLVKGKIDLPDGEEDLQPVYRFVEYGGYLGQPMMRMLMAPKKESGKRHFKDEDKDRGLWQEIIGLDGSQTIRTAKSFYVGHRVLIPVPKRKRLQEDQKTGDDARKGNYKFSSKFGGGEEHKIKDVKIEGEEKHLRRVAGVLDLLNHNYNWKGLHPFHYHKEDYKLFQESELKGEPFDRVQDMLDFGELNGKDFMSYPSPKKIKIDHRYKEVDYFQRESFFALHEDGSVQMACGYGSSMSFTAGNIVFDCPGSVMFMAGKRVVAMGWDVIFRAKNSMDFSASEKDMRFKAEGNMQFVAGNGKKGGMLFDCKSEGSSQVYDGVYGEDVQANGIVFLAKKSQIGVLGKDIYLRTGGGEIEDGNITLDASKGNKRVVLYGKHIDMYANKAVQIWNEPMDEEANPVAAHRFAKSTSIISGNLVLEKNVVITKGNLMVRKNVGAGKNVIAHKKLSQDKGIFVAPHGGKFDPHPMLDAAEEGRMKFVDMGKPMFEGDLKTPWYESQRLGNNDTIRPIGFSFRDPPGAGVQYKTQQFKMPEPRWMQMVRLSMATGGVAWTEKPVVYQGQETYPWPGKQKWKDEPSMLCYKEHKMFDAGASNAKDRSGPYEDPQLGDWDPKQPDGNFKTVL